MSEKNGITVFEYNEIRQRQIESFEDYPKATGLLCDSCRDHVEDQFHVDFSGPIPKRQVVCVGCGRSSYRYE